MKFNSPLKYFIFSCILFMLACGSKGDVHEMEGWYTMEQQIFIANGVEDVRDHTKQYKVFSDEYYSYTNMREDTLATFGFGYYTYDPATKKLVEHNLFNTSLLDSASSFDLQIEPHTAGYKQIIPKIMIAGVPNRLIEDYTRINFNNTSEMDGVWKLTEHYTIANADTVRDTRIQYKIFKGGAVSCGCSISLTKKPAHPRKDLDTESSSSTMDPSLRPINSPATRPLQVFL